MVERQNSRCEPTLEDLAKDYLARHAEINKRPRGVRDDRRMLEMIILPKLGNTTRLKALSRRDLETLHASLKSTPYQANRVLSLLSKMYSLAVEWKWVSENLTERLPRFPEDKREVWLSEDQIVSFWAALDGYSNQNAANALKLLLLTGSRVSEVLRAEWECIDLVRGVWTKPSHHTKQKKVQHVPLNHEALSLLEAMANRQAAPLSGPLFPGVKGKFRTTLRRPWVAACKSAGLTKPVARQGKRRITIHHHPTVRRHDLRHTYASHLASKDTPLPVIGKLLAGC